VGVDQIVAVGASTAYITPGSPWENGYVESFNGKLRDELLNGEIWTYLRWDSRVRLILTLRSQPRRSPQ